MTCEFIAFHMHHGCVKKKKKKIVERLHKLMRGKLRRE